MKTHGYTPDSPNTHAVTLLRSWLDAVDVPVETASGGVDLRVTRSDGTTMDVVVALDEASGRAQDAFVIRGRTLTAGKEAEALGAFQELLATLGYESRSPLERGPAYEGKASYTNDFDLVAMRHRSFRKSPNPKSADLERYMPTVKKATARAFKSNSDLMRDYGFELGDLLTYALTWTVNYLAHFRVAPERDTNSDNEKKLYTYLTQRFSELRTLLWKKRKSVMPELEEAFVGTRGEAYDPLNSGAWETALEQDGSTSRVDLILSARFGAMPRDVKIAALRKASHSADPEVRDQAAKLLAELEPAGAVVPGPVRTLSSGTKGAKPRVRIDGELPIIACTRETTKCPKCGTVATGREDIEKNFGFRLDIKWKPATPEQLAAGVNIRDGKFASARVEVTQSQCRPCRLPAFGKAQAK